MPDIIKTSQDTTPTYEKRSDGKYYRLSDTTMQFQRSRVVTVTSTKRHPPADLFASGTSRSQSRSFTNTSYGSYVHPLNGYLYTNAAYAWNHAHGYSDAPLIDDAREALYNKARSHLRRDAVNLAMCLAEYRQTAELFHGLARAVSTRGASLISGLRRPKPTTRAYLAFQYGVKPLCGDILGSIDELKQAALQPAYLHGVERQSRRGVRRGELALSGDTFDFERIITKKYRTAWRAKLNPSIVAQVLTRHGFTNPFSLAYELVPFSFVIDWWINVGDVLASLDNIILCDQLLVIDSTKTIDGEYYKSKPNARWGAGSSSRITVSNIRSAPVNVTPISTFAYKPSVSYTHIMNGLALLHMVKR